MNNNPPRKEIRCLGKLYDVTEFIEKHPGGDIMEYYVNNQEDATLAIQQFHYRSSKKVNGILKSLKNRPDVSDESRSGLRYQNMTLDFIKLHHELESEGYFKPSKLNALYRVFEVIAMAGIGGFLTKSENVSVALVGMVILGVAIHRTGYVMHEGSHNSLTGNPKIDKWLQSIFVCLGLGVSAKWYSDRHSRHHAMPRRMHHDTDLLTGPFYVTHVKLFDESQIKWKFYYQYQALLWLPFGNLAYMMYWVFWDSPRYIWRHGTYHEVALLLFKLYFLDLSISIPYIIGAHIVSAVTLLINLEMSHTHTPLTEESLHWLEYSLIHTVNVHPSWWCDWWMGYTNYQIEHHLFPSMPEFRQRTIRHRVQALARKYELPYVCLSYWDGVKAIIQNLQNVSRDIANLKHEMYKK